MDQYFTNTVSRVGGIGLKEIEAMVDRNHSRAFDPLGLDSGPGPWTAWAPTRPAAGEEDHLYNPQTIHLLQQATRPGDYELFKQYTALVDDETKPHTLRGLLEMPLCRDAASPSTRWRAWIPSSSASRPAP